MVVLLGYPDPKYLRLYKLGRAIHLDPQLRERFRNDPESVMNEFGFSEDILVQPKISEEYTRQLQEVHKALMEVGKRIRDANADTIIIFGSDHMETFWLNNYPQLLLFHRERGRREIRWGGAEVTR
jgi:hypothetical protein